MYGNNLSHNNGNSGIRFSRVVLEILYLCIQYDSKTYFILILRHYGEKFNVLAINIDNVTNCKCIYITYSSFNSFYVLFLVMTTSTSKYTVFLSLRKL